MDKKKIVIDGVALSLFPSFTGVQRYSYEIITRLDGLLEKEGITGVYAYLDGAKNKVLPLNIFKQIKPVPIKAKNRHTAELKILPEYIKSENALGICLAHEPLASKGHITCIHDIRPVEFGNGDTLKCKINFRIKLLLLKHYAGRIVTVSEYQNRAIRNYLKIREADKVVTVYSGYEHMLRITADDGIFNNFPMLERGKYYYALGSLAPHKNFKWVMEIAKRNPNSIFAIAGGKDLNAWKDNVETGALKNVVFLGYVSDGQNKALMENCKAFLQPSKYEGFGLPPLEALVCGAPVIVSDTTCMPEIYEDCAHYINPDNYDVDLEALLKEPVSPPQKIFDKCSWDKAANGWLELIKSELNKK